MSFNQLIVCENGHTNFLPEPLYSSPIWQQSFEDPTEDSEALGDDKTTRWKGTEFLNDHVENTS